MCSKHYPPYVFLPIVSIYERDWIMFNKGDSNSVSKCIWKYKLLLNHAVTISNLAERQLNIQMAASIGVLQVGILRPFLLCLKQIA